MDEFLSAFLELFSWFLGKITWDGVILSVPLSFVILSMLVLSFRKAVHLS